MEETFKYDPINRLTEIWLGDTQTGQMDYDPYGRMTSKQADGIPVFTRAVYDITSKPHAIDAAKTWQDNYPSDDQTLTYTCFDKVKTITEGNNTLEYTYGYDHQRIFMEEHANGTVRTKRYINGCERVTLTEGSNTSTKTLTYLNSPIGIFAVVEKVGSNETLHYILKDHLGSWTTITDSQGNVEQELSFDAWGTLRNAETWTGAATETPLFDRGFTGHEHLYAFGLINMNGRMYDPLMSSFLSVDAYVQSPDNAQNFNRYAYCLNNPLKYVDPSGWLMQGALMGTPGQGVHDWGNSLHAILEPRDIENGYLSDDFILAMWREGDNLDGGEEPIGGGGTSLTGGCGDFYNDKGKYLGTDGKNDGKLYILRTEDQEVKRKEREIRNFFNGKNTSLTMDDIYQYFIEIEGLKENREKMYEIVSADDGTGGTSDQNNREYGGYLYDGDVNPITPGPVGDPRIDSELSIEIPFGYSSFHSHASGYYKERKWTDVEESFWKQEPSLRDIENAGDKVNYVFGRWNKYVYIYDNRGTQVILRENTFLNIRP